MNLSRRHMLMGAVCATALTLRTPLAAASDELPAIKDILGGRNVSGPTGFALADAQTGQIIDEGLAGRALPPASVAKVATALYALENLGPTRRFVTRFLTGGRVQDGALHGDLILATGGDPKFDTDALGTLINNLKAAGVRRITGGFYVYDGAFPYMRQIDDRQTAYASYNPAISGVVFNFNRVHFEWKRAGDGYSFAMDARAKRYAPKVTVIQTKLSDHDAPVFTYRDSKDKEVWHVARNALGNGGARWLPVRNPAAYLGDVATTLSAQLGVSLPAAQVTRELGDVGELARVISEPVEELVRGMLKYSTNVTAEVLGMAASFQRGVQVSNLRSSARAMNAWAKTRFGLTGLSMVDHSGLGDASRVSARAMISLLTDAKAKAALMPLLKAYKTDRHEGPVVSSAPLTTLAKTGTLDFVTSLAGYVAGPNGETRAFAMISADLPRREEAKQIGKEVPVGARTYRAQARLLQRDMLHYWTVKYGL